MELTRQRGLFVIGLAPGQALPEAELVEKGYRVKPAEGLWEVELTDGQSIDPVVDLVRARGLNLRHLVEKRQTLEDLFLKTVEASEPGVDAGPARRAPDGRYRAQEVGREEHVRKP